MKPTDFPWPRAFAAALCLASGAAACLAQEGPSFAFAGSLSSLAAYSIENEDSAYKALSAAPFLQASARGLVDGKLSFSRDYTSLGLFDFSFADAAILSAQTGATVEAASLKVNELYADLNFGDLFFLRLGKQRLSWGSGSSYNPSDPVNPPKDPTSQRATREGVPALKAELIAKPVSVMAFAVLHDALADTGYGAKLSTSAVPNSDLSVSGYWSPSQSWTGALNLSTAPLYELPGWDSLQLWAEGCIYGKARYAAYDATGHPTAAPGGPQYAILAGGSFQVPVLRTVALAEYYRLSEGMSGSGLAAVYGALRSSVPAVQAAIAGDLGVRPARQGRDYLFVSLSQPTITDSGDPFFDKLGLSASLLINLADKSFYSSAGLSLLFVKDSSVDLSAAWLSGGADSEFGNAPSRLSLDIEAKVFF